MSFADAFEKAVLIWGVCCPVLCVVVTLLAALIRDLSALVEVYSNTLAFCAVVWGVQKMRLWHLQRAAVAAQAAAAAAGAAAQAAWNAAQAAESEDTDDSDSENGSEGEW